MVSESFQRPSAPDEPDAQASQCIYRWRSGTYDLQLAPYEGLRQEAVDHLQLEPGQVVLDIGCGTGLSLPLLQAAVGAGGRVVGVDQCPEMVAEARQRVARHGWPQVELVCAPVQSAPLPQGADAALFHFTHDVLQLPQALDHVLTHLKPGARVVVTGLKWTSPLYGPLNALVWWNALQSVTTFKDLDAPWRPLLDRGVVLTVEDRLMGALYLASGQRP
jgi:ubiquinone/menaquinone biosynthesis C-methylase UbiE